MFKDVTRLTPEELDVKLDLPFTFDNFSWQKENKIATNEVFVADGLERMLYLRTHCEAEGFMHGEGVKLRCDACEKSYTMTEFGEPRADDGDTEDREFHLKYCSECNHPHQDEFGKRLVKHC